MAAPVYSEDEYQRIVETLPTRSPIYLPTEKLSLEQRIDGVRKVADIYANRLDQVYKPKLRALREQFAGTKRAFVIGNGPSLNRTDLAALKGEVVFAVNGFFLKYGELDWRPTFYVCEDHLVAEDRADQLNALTGSIKLFPKVTRATGRLIKNATVGGKLEVFERANFNEVLPHARPPEVVEADRERAARDVKPRPKILLLDMTRMIAAANSAPRAARSPSNGTAWPPLRSRSRNSCAAWPVLARCRGRPRRSRAPCRPSSWNRGPSPPRPRPRRWSPPSSASAARLRDQGRSERPDHARHGPDRDGRDRPHRGPAPRQPAAASPEQSGARATPVP